MKTTRSALRRVAIPALALAGSLLAATTASAQQQTDSATGLTYTVANGEATVTGGTVPTGENNPDNGKLVIPETLGGTPVTAIGSSAFKDNLDVKELSASSVERIEAEAFYRCTALTEVSLLGATSIGNHAFYNCSFLTAVSLAEANSIGSRAFSGCTALTRISLPKTASISTAAFANCTSLDTVHMPVATSIGSRVFDGCTSLTTISLPKATSIRMEAFHACTSLSTISLFRATSIGNHAFYNCDALTTISLPRATSIGIETFYACDTLATVSLPEASSIADSAFLHCSALTGVYLGRNPTLGSNAFANTHADLTIHHHPEYHDHFASGNWASLTKNEVVRPFSEPVDIAPGSGTATLTIRHAATTDSNDDWTYTVEQSTDLVAWTQVSPSASDSNTADSIVTKSRTVPASAPAAFYRVQAKPTFFGTD